MVTTTKVRLLKNHLFRSAICIRNGLDIFIFVAITVSFLESRNVIIDKCNKKACSSCDIIVNLKIGKNKVLFVIHTKSDFSFSATIFRIEWNMEITISDQVQERNQDQTQCMTSVEIIS